MEQKLNCQFVQDLLPNYIEGLTSEYTNKAMKHHLSTCNECREALASMTTETREIKIAPRKQINFLKKIQRRQWYIACLSVLVSIVVLVGVWYFVNQRDFPVTSSNVTISDVYQMKDGSIHYRISASVNGYVSRVKTQAEGDSEVVEIFEHRRFGSGQDKIPITLQERWSTLPSTNPDITSIYNEGEGAKDRILIWEKGMDIQKATAEQEAAYKNAYK